MMEELSNHGNGNYYYIDSEREGKKVLVDGFNGTIETIAKDVKLQVEFNPNVVQSYRLIGYQNRRLQAEDFNNDKKDAGDIGSGHSVVAFYEVIPQGLKQIDNLKYQKTLKVESNNLSSEMLTVKLRYKKPDASKSKLIEKVISAKSKKKFKSSSDNFKWSVAVASFADILRGGQLSEGFTYDKVLEIAAPLENKIEADKTYRREFIDIIKKAKRVSSYSSSSNESTYQKKSIRKTSNAKIETGGQEEYYAGPNIDKEPIRRVIRKNKRAIKACYELGLHNRNPKMQGKLVLGWTIAEWGKAISPKVISNSLNDKEVANCIKRKLVTWRFPVLPENAKHIVNYPFIFTN